MSASSIPDASPNNSEKMMKKHPIFFYFFLTYVISWIFVIPYVLSGWIAVPEGIALISATLRTFGPALAAIIVINVTEGKEGLHRLQKRIRLWRVGWPWYLFALVGIPIMIVLGIIIQPGTLVGIQGFTIVTLVSYLIYFVIVLFGGGPLGEEPGWRGFALPRVQSRYGPLWGTLLLGILWAFWHLPDYLMPEYQGEGPGSGITSIYINFPIFILMILSIAIVFTWIFNHTKGSVFIAILAHTSVNMPQVVLIPLFPAVSVTNMFLATLICFGIPALLILFLTRGHLGYHPEQEKP